MLIALAEPASTSQTAHTPGIALGAVGNHLPVLREAGLHDRAPAGRSVIFRRTPLGDALATDRTHQWRLVSACDQRDFTGGCQPYHQPAPLERLNDQ